MNAITNRYKQLGVDFDPTTVTMRKALRINTLKAPEDIVQRLEARGIQLEKIPFLDQGYWYEADFSLASVEEHLLGYIYIQETASQLPAEILHKANPSPNRILDLCAAPGSKATQLAALTKNNVPIDALDTDQKRLLTLKSACERLGVTSIISHKLEGQYAKDLGKQYDAVLIDAPCSGNFCIEPNFFTSRLPQDFADRAKLQKILFERALRVTSPGGIICYSTCSLEPEENEFVVQWALDNLSVELLPIELAIGEPGMTQVFGKELSEEVTKTKRFWPHKTNTEGFFIALFKKI